MSRRRGRPPDDVVVVEGLNVLERSGSPVPQAVQPLQKRGRGLEEAMLIDDELINEETEVRVLDGGGQQLKDAAGGMSELPIPSFKDKLVGDKGVSSNVRLLMELDVDVREDDNQNRDTRAVPSKVPGGSRFAVLEEEGEVLKAGADRRVREEELVAGVEGSVRVAPAGNWGRVRIGSAPSSPKASVDGRNTGAGDGVTIVQH
ncbi:hypothetical protein V6N12_072872 [Hibiscus sabdariffa]|uniref:Uncharacterized protein n=1 Tax=Hibiscus sabdariffa TaxID=183260 RepID=A0ABR2AZV5_9ROSI